MDALMEQRLAGMVADALASSDIEYVHRIDSAVDAMLSEVVDAAEKIGRHYDRLRRTNQRLFTP